MKKTIIACALLASTIGLSARQVPVHDAVTAGATPVFLQPGTMTPLRTMPSGTHVKVLQERGPWAEIEFNDPQFGRRVGWVELKLLRMSLPAMTPPAAPASRPSPEPAPAAAPPSRQNSSPVQSPRKSGKSIKIRGYVTNLVSPTEFEIEDYRITRDNALVLDFENADPSLRFNPSDIRVGVELEIKGNFYEATGELTAQSIKVDMEQFKKIKQTAVIARAPVGISRAGSGWTGEFLADGQRIVITPSTEIVYKLTSREKKQARKKVGTTDEEFAPITSLDQIAVGVLLTYEGQRRISDGAIAAERIEVINNDLEEGEAKLWKSLKVSATPAQAFRPGELKIDKVGKFKLLPSDEVQQYVTQLGHRLVPGYQRDLAEGTPHKIPFRFYVIQNDAANAFALPNGIIVVHSGLIDLLDNEAQLAAVVGHEIAHSVQEHSWRQMQYHKKKRVGLAILGAVAAAYGQYDLSNLVDMVQGAIQNGHSRSLENQADRVGLEYMVAAGYDPREAPRVWKLMTKKYGLQATNVFWSSHENQATRRSYLMNELKNNYRDLDYASLALNEDQFRRVQALVQSAAEQKPRVKVR